MPDTAKSSVMTADTKPNNVFYIWYSELCRRMNSNSACMVRPPSPKCNTVLDFVADRLKLEDWNPLLNALRHDTSLHVINIRSRMSNCQFLHDVDTEDKARRMKRKYGALWTDFISNSLVKALSFSMKKTQVLTCLELDGLPLFSQYLDSLLKALMENRTLKNFSLTNCSIEDEGCRSVCTCLQMLPNVEWLNLSRCNLSSVSGMYIAKLIKFQQLNRYTTSWHKSLRYSEPDSDQMCGIRRITLNANPNLGDEGLNYILNELEDDLWIKALDVQKCGITEAISNKIIDILQYNSSLKIADFRQNGDLHPCTLEKILDILRDRETYAESENEFQWGTSVLSLQTSMFAFSSRSRVMSACEKDKTVVVSTKNVRAKTSTEIVRRSTNGFCNKTVLKDEHKRKLIEVKIMNHQEHYEETMKKKEIVRKMRVCKTSKINKINHDNNITNSIVKTFGKLQVSKEDNAPYNSPVDTPMRNGEIALRPLNGIKLNGLKNGYKIKEEEEPATVTKSPSCLFEDWIKSKPAVEEKDEDSSHTLMSPYAKKEEVCTLERSDVSESQTSLYDFMEDLKGEKKTEESERFKSKHHYKGKKNGIK